MGLSSRNGTKINWARLIQKIYEDADKVMELVQVFGEPVRAGMFDPWVQGEIGCVDRKEPRIFLNAPVVIFLASNDRMARPEL